MGNGSGVSRGDRNRNARLARLRAAVPVSNAIVGIDLADRKQMVVVCDHDSKVLARKTFRCKAWDLGSALDWAAEHAARHGYAGVTVACEPTGHRWRVLGQLAADRGMPFVCVQPALSSWARKTEDLTSDKTDEKDAVLIARLTAQLRCYPPSRWRRRGGGGGIWVPAGNGCWPSTSRGCSRSAICSSVCGRPRWRRPASRSSPSPGSPAWPWSWAATAGT
jgi:hypothetical protein